MILYLGFYRPWENPFTNRLEFFNELATLFIVYHMACFSNFYDDIEVRYHVLGNTFIYATYVIIAINSSVIIFQFFHTCGVSYKKKKMLKRYTKQLAELEKIKELSRKYYTSTYDVSMTPNEKLKHDFI